MLILVQKLFQYTFNKTTFRISIYWPFEKFLSFQNPLSWKQVLKQNRTCYRKNKDLPLFHTLCVNAVGGFIRRFPPKNIDMNFLNSFQKRWFLQIREASSYQ